MIKQLASFFSVLFFSSPLQSIEGICTGRDDVDDQYCYFEVRITLENSLVSNETCLLVPKKLQRLRIKEPLTEKIPFFILKKKGNRD